MANRLDHAPAGNRGTVGRTAGNLLAPAAAEKSAGFCSSPESEAPPLRLCGLRGCFLGPGVGAVCPAEHHLLSRRCRPARHAGKPETETARRLPAARACTA